MKKLKRKRVVRSGTYGRTDDKSFLIIVGGGFLIVLFALFFLGGNRFRSLSHMPMMGSHMVGKNVVVIRDYTFVPASISVRKGETVYWTNQDKVAHNVSATDSSFTTGEIFEGGEGSFMFQDPGVYAYYSTTYPNVRGTVIVE